MEVAGSVTIKLPRDEHMLIHLASSGVAGASQTHWTCFLCSQKAFSADDFHRLRCIPQRVIYIEVREDE